MLARMAKILTLVLGLLVVSFLAWKAVSGRSLVGTTGEAPTQTLREAREAAKRIEDDSAKRNAEKLKAGDDR
jgi:hypothetical protein